MVSVDAESRGIQSVRHCLDGDGRPGFWDALKREESSAEQDEGNAREDVSLGGGGRGPEEST